MIMLRVFAVMLNLVSAALTGLGVYAYLVDGVGFFLPPDISAIPVTAAIALVFTVIVQAALNELWWRFGKAPGARGLPNAAVALCFSVVSWFCAAGGLVIVEDHIAMKAEKQQEQASTFAAPLAAFAERNSRVAGEMQALSQQALDLADREQRIGGTCPDDVAPGGTCGPRCRLRQRHADELEEAASIARRLAERATHLSVDIASAGDVAAERSVYREARGLAVDPRRSTMEMLLRQAVQELAGPVQDPVTGSTFTCIDPGFRAEIERLLGSIDTSIALPAAPPVAQTVDMSDALKAVAKQIGAWARGETADYIGPLPLLLATALETMIVALLLVEARQRRSLGLFVRPEDEREMTPLPLDPTSRAMIERVLEALATYAVSAGPLGDYLAVPLDGAEAARAEALDVVRYFRLRSPVATAVPLEQLEPEWVRGRIDRCGHASAFDLYRLPVDIHDWAADAACNIRHARQTAST